MEQLQQMVRPVVSYRPMTVTNIYPTQCSSAEERDQAVGSIEAVENLVLHLTRVLSDGLYAGLDLWSVLQTLDRIDSRLSPEAKPLYKFAPHLVFVIKSSMPKANEFLKTKAFLRLALSTGCLLASLELLAVYNEDIVTSYMMDHALVRSRGTSAWDKFVKCVSQVGGPPLEMITPGFIRGPQIVPLDLTACVPALDDNAERIQQQKLYVSGLLSSLPEFEHPSIPIAPRAPEPAATPSKTHDEVSASPEASDVPHAKKTVKKVVRKRTIIKKVLRPSAGGASSIGDESETRSQNPSSFIGGSDNEQDANDEETVSINPGHTAEGQVLTKRQYISSDAVSHLLDHHHKRARALDSCSQQLEQQIATLIAEGAKEGWYFEIDETGHSCDCRLRCSTDASEAIDAALDLAEQIVLRRREMLLEQLADRETQLMQMEESST